jgi:hypothetical protein
MRPDTGNIGSNQAGQWSNRAKTKAAMPTQAATIIAGDSG